MAEEAGKWKRHSVQGRSGSGAPSAGRRRTTCAGKPARRPTKYVACDDREDRSPSHGVTGFTKVDRSLPGRLLGRGQALQSLLALQRPHVGGLGAPLALGDVELDSLPLIK